MPERYDRAVCAAELRLRNSVLSRIGGGWRPVASFEIPDDASKENKKIDSASADSTSQSPTASFIARAEENIADPEWGDNPAGSQSAQANSAVKCGNFI